MTTKYKFSNSYKLYGILSAIFLLPVPIAYYFDNPPYETAEGITLWMSIFLLIILIALVILVIGSSLEITDERLILKLNFGKEEINFSDIAEARIIPESSINTEFENYQRSEKYQKEKEELEKNLDSFGFREQQDHGHYKLEKLFVMYQIGGNEKAILMTLKDGVKYVLTPAEVHKFCDELNAKL